MLNFLKPVSSIDERSVNRGLRMLIYDGIASQIMGTLAGGAFLVAFALANGASNLTIGLIAAIGPFAQLLQIPAISLVDKTGLRKFLVVASSFFSRLFWVVIAITPWVIPGRYRIPVILASLFLYFGLGAISGCAFNSWMRDLIPERIMGSYFGKRMTISAIMGAILSIIAGFGLDYYKGHVGGEITALSYMILFGALAGLIGVTFLGRIPEPKMPISDTKGIVHTLSEPFRDLNFRKLLYFLGSWNFVVNLVSPFFVVYMLTRLGLSMAFIIGLSVASQVMNVLFFRIWGRLSDRFSNKSVLVLAGPLFMISILLWPFTTMPEKYILTIPILVAIHVLAGISTAGVALCTGNIALKLAPRGKATSYLATNAVVSGCTATVAPILGGLAANWFATRQLTLALTWTSMQKTVDRFSVTPLNLRGLDFLFIFAFIIGLYAVHRLLAVREEGEVGRKVVLGEFYVEVRKAVRNVSNVAGLRHLTYFPYAFLKHMARVPRRFSRDRVRGTHNIQ